MPVVTSTTICSRLTFLHLPTFAPFCSHSTANFRPRSPLQHPPTSAHFSAPPTPIAPTAIPLTPLSCRRHASTSSSLSSCSCFPETTNSGSAGAPGMHGSITTPRHDLHFTRWYDRHSERAAMSDPASVCAPHPLSGLHTGQTVSTPHACAPGELKSGVRTAVALLLREIQHLKVYRNNQARSRAAIARVDSLCTHKSSVKIMGSQRHAYVQKIHTHYG
jgi:hypothetical protein